MDLTESIAPASDQLDAVDLLTGPRAFTIEKVSAGSVEQPFNFHLAEFARVWRPGKSMRRVLVKAWGPDASVYVGRRVTLYCDETVRFGSDVVGGTRIKAMTDLPGGKRLSVPLLISRGKSAMFTVEPLTDAAPAKAKPPAKPAAKTEPIAADIAMCTDRDLLGEMWRKSGPARRKQIEARVAELNAKTDPPDDGPGPSDADWDLMGQPATS